MIIIPNLPPIISMITTEFHFSQDEEFEIQFLIHDPNDDPIEAKLAFSNGFSIPDWLKFDQDESKIYGKCSDIHDLDLNITCHDGTLTVSQNFLIKIREPIFQIEAIKDQDIILEGDEKMLNIPINMFHGVNISFMDAQKENGE